MPNEMVTMTHPKIKDQKATTTRKAFEDVWKDKGWEIDDDSGSSTKSSSGSTSTKKGSS